MPLRMEVGLSPVSHGLFTLLLSPSKWANGYISWNSSREWGFLPKLLHFYATVIRPVLEYCPQSGIMPSPDYKLNIWSLYKSMLFTLFIFLLGACHILIYCSSLSLPHFNPGVTNFQSHSFKTSVTHPLPSIIYFPLPMIHLACIGSEQPHGLHVLSHAPKNIVPLLITP